MEMSNSQLNLMMHMLLLRGFAKSELNSSVVLSAGMNPRLYGYFEQFTDFFPDKDGILKRKLF